MFPSPSASNSSHFLPFDLPPLHLISLSCSFPSQSYKVASDPLFSLYFSSFLCSFFFIICPLTSSSSLLYRPLLSLSLCPILLLLFSSIKSMDGWFISAAGLVWSSFYCSVKQNSPFLLCFLSVCLSSAAVDSYQATRPALTQITAGNVNKNKSSWAPSFQKFEVYGFMDWILGSCLCGTTAPGSSLDYLPRSLSVNIIHHYVMGLWSYSLLQYCCVPVTRCSLKSLWNTCSSVVPYDWVYQIPRPFKYFNSWKCIYWTLDMQIKHQPGHWLEYLFFSKTKN